MPEGSAVNSPIQNSFKGCGGGVLNISFSDKYPCFELTGEKSECRPTLKLNQNVLVCVGYHRMVIPQGFITDGGSVPCGLWNWFNPLDPEYFPATLIHDFLYVTEYFPRGKCDQIFYEALRALKINRVKAYLMFLAVRVGGQNSWNIRTRKQVIDSRNIAGIYSEDRPLLD